MVGTTVFSGLFIIRTTLVKEAGWTMEDRRTQNRDAMLSAAMMFGASAAVMAAAAGTLHKAGIGLTDAAQMVQLLEPFAGQLGVTIFVFGIIAAGVSSQFPNVMLLPWLLCDYSGRPRDMTLPRYRIMVGILSLLGLVVPVFNAKPVAVMIASQAFGSLLLPVTVLSILILGNKRSVMGDHRHSVIENIILLLVFAFSLIMSFYGLRGLWSTLSTLL
jgi:Mn2+/Fe2+ NRAMP family transporter